MKKRWEPKFQVGVWNPVKLFFECFFLASLPGMCPLPPQLFLGTTHHCRSRHKNRTASEQKTEDMLTKRKKLEQEAEKKRLEEEVRNAFVAGNDLPKDWSWTYVCFFFIWVALGSMNITGSCLVLKLDNNLRSCCLFFFQNWSGMMSCTSIFDKTLDVKVCDCQTRNIWHPWLSQRHLQEPPFRWELPEKMYTLTLPKINSKRPWKKWCFKGKPFLSGQKAVLRWLS